MTNKINTFLWWILAIWISASSSYADTTNNRIISIINDNGSISCGSVNQSRITSNCRKIVKETLWVDLYYDLKWEERDEFDWQLHACVMSSFDESLAQQWLSRPDNSVIHNEFDWEKEFLDFQDPTAEWVIAPPNVDINDFSNKIEDSCTVALTS